MSRFVSSCVELSSFVHTPLADDPETKHGCHFMGRRYVQYISATGSWQGVIQQLFCVHGESTSNE